MKTPERVIDQTVAQLGAGSATTRFELYTGDLGFITINGDHMISTGLTAGGAFQDVSLPRKGIPLRRVEKDTSEYVWTGDRYWFENEAYSDTEVQARRVVPFLPWPTTNKTVPVQKNREVAVRSTCVDVATGRTEVASSLAYAFLAYDPPRYGARVESRSAVKGAFAMSGVLPEELAQEVHELALVKPAAIRQIVLAAARQAVKGTRYENLRSVAGMPYDTLLPDWQLHVVHSDGGDRMPLGTLVAVGSRTSL